MYDAKVLCINVATSSSHSLNLLNSWPRGGSLMPQCRIVQVFWPHRTRSCQTIDSSTIGTLCSGSVLLGCHAAHLQCGVLRKASINAITLQIWEQWRSIHSNCAYAVHNQFITCISYHIVCACTCKHCAIWPSSSKHKHIFWQICHTVIEES